MSDDDDDFQNPTPAISLTQKPLKKPTKTLSSQPLKPSNGSRSKKLKRCTGIGKENIGVTSAPRDTSPTLVTVGLDDIVCSQFDGAKVCESVMSTCSNFVISSFRVSDSLSCEKDRMESGETRVFSSAELQSPEQVTNRGSDSSRDEVPSQCNEKCGLKSNKGYLSNSIESRLLASSSGFDDNRLGDENNADFELCTQLNDLIEMCWEEDDFPQGNGSVDGLVECPLCRADISNLTEELRQVHTNDCLDKNEDHKIDPSSVDTRPRSPQRVPDVSPVLEWLRSLGLSRYEEVFIKEEVDWDTLHCLTEEDLLSIGVTALGPRKKIIHALNELRKGNTHAVHRNEGVSKIGNDGTKKPPGNKLITEFFPGSSVNRNRETPRSLEQHGPERRETVSSHRRGTTRNCSRKEKSKDIPPWCCIPGTPFRVDAFRSPKGDCLHWFLTHFHLDHYQGLTKNFCSGKIYCSSITAQLVNTKIGIQWDKLQVLPLNQKVSIAGVDVICLDANHCPGSIIILFDLPNGKAVLHTGDFRFCEEMTRNSTLQSCSVQTLILDTTYCNPQYDFPKQEAVIQFVIDAIQAEAFNPKTLFLIGSYTIGKERLFIEVARCLQKKVYVGTAKLHTLRCLELPEEDMKWFTSNEKESHIHVVPLWTIASFKRMKYISNQYSSRFTSIVAFSPTGWSYGKGKKKSPGRRWQQGTIIRYEVPYSEHCSFSELKEFVQFISPENIIPSVNNNGPESVDAMVTMLKS